MQNKYYITTPIYYPSGKPHIGHCYTTVACDSIARYRRKQGFDVMFLTGTDEHGQKIEQKAKEAGITPKEYVDRMSDEFKSLWKYMNISYDRYIRTTDDYHEKTVKSIFKRLYDKGYIYKGSYEGKYCTPCESFWTPTQVVDGKCPDCGRPVIDAKEEAYFFKMSAFSDKLERLLLDTDYLQPKNRGIELVNNFIKPGLEDLCVSRTSLKWGIPVDFDEKHVVYVWIDALSNYISALGYDNNAYDDFDKFWPADIHMVAKDIMRFHALIWPAILMALELPLPKHLAVHGWITFNGQKMSKSKGNVVDPKILGGRYGADTIRYHILREMAIGADSSFSNEVMINRINTDLANGLGNLVSRTVAMACKYFDGKLPVERKSAEVDDELISLAISIRDKVDNFIDNTQLNLALAEIFKLVDRSNKYIDETEPWVLGRQADKKDRLASVLYNLLESIRIASSLLSSFMPTTMPEVWRQIGAKDEDVIYDNMNRFGILPLDVQVTKGNIIFPRIDIEKEIDELNKYIVNSNEQSRDVEQIKDTIEYNIFAGVDLRVAKVLECVAVPKSKKLLRLIVDDGIGKRQILSGIGETYKPDQLIGKSLAIVANLSEKTICGFKSNGMILATNNSQNGITVMFVDDSLKPGTVIC